ncbi:hypothetical protein Tco_1526808 [Tanacetum coccineum]
MQGSHDQLNVNQQTIAYCLCWELEIDKADILFSDLIASLHPTSGKPEPKTNISYTRYLSLIMEHLLEDKYKNDDLLSLKPHNTTATTFKPTLKNKVALIAHMCKVAALSPYLIKSLLPPSREVNVDDTADKSSSGTSMQPVTQSKAPTVRKPRKKKILSSTQPKALQSIRESSPTTQVAETQSAEETMAIADATKCLDASVAREASKQPAKNAEIRKVPEKIVEKEEVVEEQTMEIPTVAQLLDEVNKAAQETPQSPYDTESEIFTCILT